MIALALFFVIVCSACAGSRQAELPKESAPFVFVESEFAPLKTVIVSQSEFTDPVLPLSQGYPPIDEIEACGGGVIVYHRQIFVGNSGYESNSAGIAWLRKYLAPYGYTVSEVRLQGNILYLDCAMSLVREGLLIACEESFANGIPEPFRDWDRITVPEEDAEHLAVNGLPISPEVYVTDVAFRDTIGKELEARGVKLRR